jgi:hypothetical protein
MLKYNLLRFWIFGNQRDKKCLKHFFGLAKLPANAFDCYWIVIGVVVVVPLVWSIQN